MFRWSRQVLERVKTLTGSQIEGFVLRPNEELAADKKAVVSTFSEASLVVLQPSLCPRLTGGFVVFPV